MSIAVRPVAPHEAGRLPEIERDAAARFRSVGLGDIADGAVSSPDFIAAVIRHGVALGAASEDGRLAAFALAGRLDGGLHIYELSVAVAHGGRGLGSALLDGLDRAARDRGLAALTLSTFADVPWNAPFYARRGFRALAEPDWTPALHLVRSAERAAALPLGRRVFMLREITG